MGYSALYVAPRAPISSSARLLMFTGKGGVGKTSVAAACALAAAAEGRRPLVVEMGHRASLEGLFEGQEIGYQPSDVGRGVHAMSLDFESALVDYLEEHVKIRRVVRGITGNKALMRFFQAAPSVGEVATLNKLAGLEAEQLGGKPRWDPIVVDLDATGHAIMLLNLPRVMDGLIGDGPMRSLIDGFSALLSDPRRTVLSLVTLPRELPAQETLELFERLDSDHDVPLGALIVNQVPTTPLPADAGEAYDELRSRVGDQPEKFPALAQALKVAARARERHTRARAQIEQLRERVDLPVIELRAHDARLDLDALTALGARISDPDAGAVE